MADREELGELLSQIDIEDWLDRQGVRYRVTRGARGVQLNVQECPCCGNSGYKVYLNRDTGLGNCFSGDCEKKFNKWSFISATLGLSNREVIDHIKAVARERGWQPPRTKSMAVNYKSELILPESVALPINGRNLKYLDNRGITPQMARYFNLRFSKSGVFQYLDPESGRKRVQDYAMRIIIPVFDLEGDLVSFQGRDITGTAEKKYLFPPGFSSTGSHLYNGHNAAGAQQVVIGEGAFDVIATKIALDGEPSLRNVIPLGSFGKHLSHGDEESQVAKLLKLKEGGLEIVTFMWDGEDRAIDAAIDAGLNLRRYGLKSRIAILPKDKDPNEVPPSTVRNAYWKAERIDANVAARLRVARRVA